MAVKHIFNTRNHCFGITGFVFAPPMVEPSAPKLATHQRCIRTSFLQLLKLCINIGSCSEINCPNQIIQSVTLKSRTPVTLKQRYIGKTGSFDYITYIGYIFFVGSIGSVFIFHLYHNDISSAAHLQIRQFLTNLIHKEFCPFKEIGIIGAELDIFLFQQPPRQSAHFPFRTDIRTGTQHDVHSMFLCQTAKCSNVILPFKIKLALFLFVYVPKSINTNGIHAKCLTHLYTMFPILGRNTGIMHLGCFYQKGLAIQQKCFITNRKSMFLLLYRTTPHKHQRTKEEKQDKEFT